MYIIPIGVELGFNSIVLANFLYFAQAIEFAMTLVPRTEADLKYLHELIVKFLTQYEQLYVGDNPENISRFRLCIFQLIHVPQHIMWNGSVRLGSQATVERSIGEMSHRIRSKKAVFANLANQIYERELLKVLLLYYPELDCNKSNVNVSINMIKPSKKMKIHRREQVPGQEFFQHLSAISTFLEQDISAPDNQLQLVRWGKVRLGGELLHSVLSDSSSAELSGMRYSRWFEVQDTLNHIYC